MTKTSCPEGKIQSGRLCVDATTTKAAIVDCVDVDLSKVLSGSKVTMCDGSTGVGTYVAPSTSSATSCTIDGQLGCLSSSDFPVVKKSAISASKIAFGTTIAGITGTKRDIKQCRNASNLSYYDISPAADTKKIPSTIMGFPGGNAVTLAWAHGLVLNDPVQLHCLGVGTGLPGGAVFTGVTYYAIPASATDIRFQATPSGGALSVTGMTGCIGSGWIVGHPSDGIANIEDTIDDYNGFSSTLTAPSSSPWGSDYLCNESNFTNISGSSPFSPSNTIPTNANQSWSQIWRDELTGLLVTNILYDGVPGNRDWYQLNAMCKGLDALNGGAGGTGWRLPTQKELWQLLIDGISKVSLAGGSTHKEFWSSSGVSSNTVSVWAVYLSQGYTTNYARNSTSTNFSALCVR